MKILPKIIRNVFKILNFCSTKHRKRNIKFSLKILSHQKKTKKNHKISIKSQFPHTFFVKIYIVIEILFFIIKMTKISANTHTHTHRENATFLDTKKSLSSKA